MLNVSILYRGPLTSCNYACNYCPLRKPADATIETRDETAINRFVDWAAKRTDDRISVFFTPAGEALIHARYQRAVQRLTQMPGIVKVAAQTNLSFHMDWIRSCRVEKLALWCTYHPHYVSQDEFLEQCRVLDSLGVRYSVGMVGLREYLPAAEQIKSLLPSHIYLWINAFKHETDYYTDELIRRFTEIDPLFPISLCRHASYNRACRTGHHVISVNGDGVICRCHFVDEPLGNLYQPGWEKTLRPRSCPNPECHCHIGYVHLEHLGLKKVFGKGLLERIPAQVSSIGL